LYAHMNETIVYSGASVVKGQVIGYVGNTGRSTGPHIHFEIRGAKNPF
jgi:murein DD-endopeptidase MepM/ murein hydrolase activator NlpD